MQRHRTTIAGVAERIRKGADRVPTPISYRPADAAFVLGVCRGTIYDMIAEGRLEGRKLGTATVIPHESLVAALAAAPLAEATKRART